MTPDDIRAMLDAATPGPWAAAEFAAHDAAVYVAETDPDRHEHPGALLADSVSSAADARLMAAAPDLAAEVLRLRAVVDAAAAGGRSTYVLSLMSGGVRGIALTGPTGQEEAMARMIAGAWAAILRHRREDEVAPPCGGEPYPGAGDGSGFGYGAGDGDGDGSGYGDDDDDDDGQLDDV